MSPNGTGRRRARPAPEPVGGRLALLARLITAPGPVTAGLVVGGLVCAALVVQSTAHGAAPVRAISDQVRTADLICPPPVDQLAGAHSTVAFAAVPPNADAATHGLVTVSDLTPPGVVRTKLTTPGSGRTDVTSAPATLVRGRDGLAPGLAAELITDTPMAAGSWVSAVPCAAPAVSAWFVGASTAAGRRDRLVLSNPEVTPATVDLHLWDEHGPVDAPNSTDIAIPPVGVVSIPLEGMTPGHQRLAVQVTAVRGQVAAALHDLDAVGVAGRGDDWIAPVPGPARRLVLPGLPDGTAGRTLYLAAPGRADAVVKVRLLTGDNDFAPAGADSINLPAGQVGEYDLSSAGNAPTAVVISADRPVLASVRVTRTERGGGDVAYATATAPLARPTVVADGRAGAAGATALLLTAPTADGLVHMDVFTGSGPPRESDLRIPAGRVLLVDPTPVGAQRFTVVLSPARGSGPVYGARVLRSAGGGVAVTPLAAGRVSVLIPAVVPDVTAVTARD